MCVQQNNSQWGPWGVLLVRGPDLTHRQGKVLPMWRVTRPPSPVANCRVAAGWKRGQLAWYNIPLSTEEGGEGICILTAGWLWLTAVWEKGQMIIPPPPESSSITVQSLHVTANQKQSLTQIWIQFFENNYKKSIAFKSSALMPLSGGVFGQSKFPLQQATYNSQGCGAQASTPWLTNTHH